ncbi:MAG: hypothetical protein JJU06_01620 [Ectothiorhodospiraceae bacterium]|nr:hypothetical protein [Ectothiorhodospiraceae bacterium]MCH8502817.1 hypothetical protein [Ectothiorhodospiraceae bacterium]
MSQLEESSQSSQEEPPAATRRGLSPVPAERGLRLRTAGRRDLPPLEGLAAGLSGNNNHDHADLSRILSAGYRHGVVHVLETAKSPRRIMGYGYYLQTVPDDLGRGDLVLRLAEEIRYGEDGAVLLLSVAQAAIRSNIAVLRLGGEADRIAGTLGLRGRLAPRRRWWQQAWSELDLTLDDRRLRPAVRSLTVLPTRAQSA